MHLNRNDSHYMKRGDDKTCGRFDNPHETFILKTVCLKCGEIHEYRAEKK